jgi:uncharacterized protein YxeA
MITDKNESKASQEETQAKESGKKPKLTNEEKIEAKAKEMTEQFFKTILVEAEKTNRNEYLKNKPDLTDEEKAESKKISRKQQSNNLFASIFLLAIVGWIGYSFFGCVYDRTNPEAVVKREAKERADTDKTIKENNDYKQREYNKQRDEENRKFTEGVVREMEYQRNKK